MQALSLHRMRSPTITFSVSSSRPGSLLELRRAQVHCFHYYSLGKSQNLVGEMKGEITGDYALRKHGLPNIWSFLSENAGFVDASS